LLGYNWRFGNFVTGAEADISWSGIRGSKTQSPIIQNNGTPFPGAGLIKASEDIDWFGTVRGRLGIVPVDKWLIFATGGLAFANVKYSATTDFRPVGTEQYPASVHKTKTGWTLGLGTEWAAQSNLSVKFEYLYYDLGHESELASPQPPLPPFAVKYKWQMTGNIVRFGLNYSF
jgi:outer membrane immunogenic protein